MHGQNSGQFWVTAAALIAIQIAQGRSAGELELLGSFFTCVAVNLLLIAGQLPDTNNDQNN